MSCGDQPISYAEIKAWCEFSGIELTLWEAETMRSTSSAYLTGLTEYSEDGVEPPYTTPEFIRQQKVRYSRNRLAQLKA